MSLCHFIIVIPFLCHEHSTDQGLLCIIYAKCMEWPHKVVISAHVQISSVKPNIFCLIQMPYDPIFCPYSFNVIIVHGSQIRLSFFLKNYSAYKKIYPDIKHRSCWYVRTWFETFLCHILMETIMLRLCAVWYL
jgi:hypothetical protein